ncbi:unnamed protein product [Rhizoctonia solani]|uniref:Helicase C-terminal domain-containing protein n=1 Tax=Rhizoctonia solani TaxID=456999 RepID=A0A8H2ZWP4_9AGAM|nr:unnamed protein product [Rhizoctonia solani]
MQFPLQIKKPVMAIELAPVLMVATRDRFLQLWTTTTSLKSPLVICLPQIVSSTDWHRQLRFGVCVMHCGPESFSEITHFFDQVDDLVLIPRSLVFADSYGAIIQLERELHRHFEPLNSREVVSVHHPVLSNGHRQIIVQMFRDGTTRIIVGAEPSLMGIELPGVTRIISFLPPQTIDNWVQRVVHGTNDALCECAIMAPKSLVKKSADQCDAIGLDVEPSLLSIQVEPRRRRNFDPIEVYTM